MSGPQTQIRFQETQTIGRWIWLVASIVGISNFVTPTVAALQEARRRRWPWRKQRAHLATLAPVIPAMLMGVFAISMIISLRLVTEVRLDGLYYRFFPLVPSFRRIGFDQISEVEAIRYSPLRDYGGWGVRFGLRGQGTAFTVRGNRGVVITTKEGTKRLLGSQRPDELAAAIRQGMNRRNGDQAGQAV